MTSVQALSIADGKPVHKEMLAVVYTMITFCTALSGHAPCPRFSDHAALRYLNTQAFGDARPAAVGY